MAGLEVLLCKVRERLCALPLVHVVETMRPLPVEVFPDMPPAVRGLAIVRGKPTPVIDAAALVGLDAPPDEHRFVTLRTGDRCFAVAVDEVIGVRSLPMADLEGLPPLLGVHNADVVTAVASLDRELLLVLDSLRIVPEDAWSMVDVAGTA